MKIQIETFFKENLQNKKFHYLLIFLVSCLIAIPLIPLQIVLTHDGNLHVLRLIGTALSVNNINFPHLIIPFFCRDLGYSINAFYSPMATYLPFIFTAFPISYTTILKIYTYFTILLSGYTMYHCTFEITKKGPIALMASILYMLAPYRLEDIYTRFALAEFTTFVFIPIVIQGMHNLLQGDQKKHFYITIGAVGLILSHAITTMYFSMLCFGYLCLFWKKLIQKEVWTKIIWNVVFILGLSAFHWIVLLEFQNFAHYVIFDEELMRTNSEFVALNTISITDFIVTQDRELSFELGIFTILAFFSSIFFISKIKKEKTFSLFLIYAVLSLLLCTNIFPWQIVPNFLCKIQYPWRMLGIFVFFSSLMIAVNLSWSWEALKNKKHVRDFLLMLSMIILGVEVISNLMIYCINHQSYQGRDTSYEQNTLNNLNFSIYYINRDYLPYQSLLHQDMIEERDTSVHVIEGEATIENEEKVMTDLVFKIKNAKEDTKIELPYFYYPGYRVVLYSDGEEVLQQEESESGMVQITLPKDIVEGKIQVSYQGTALEKISYGISFITFAIFVIQISRLKRKPKKEVRT